MFFFEFISEIIKIVNFVRVFIKCFLYDCKVFYIVRMNYDKYDKFKENVMFVCVEIVVFFLWIF